jgi:uncharacterized membrane protein YraQ (UPF0718 family)
MSENIFMQTCDEVSKSLIKFGGVDIPVNNAFVNNNVLNSDYLTSFLHKKFSIFGYDIDAIYLIFGLILLVIVAFFIYRYYFNNSNSNTNSVVIGLNNNLLTNEDNASSSSSLLSSSSASS